MKKIFKSLYDMIYGNRKRTQRILNTCNEFWYECEMLKKGENNE